MMNITIPYYEDNTRISNSSIGYFLNKGPKFFRDMLDGKIEKLDLPQLRRGTMIHEFILQPEFFWNDYIVADFETPKSKQQKDFCQYYADIKLSDPLIDDNEALLNAFNKAYVNKISDTAKLVTAKEYIDKYKDYIDSLTEVDQRLKISYADLTMLNTIKTNIYNHKKAKELLEDIRGVESHNEFHINWELKVNNWLAPCKSLLDRCIFDHIDRKITLIDLKTTSDVFNFKHSVEEFDYYRQITYYLMALTWYFNDLDIDISDYDCEAYIIAIQTNGNYEIRVFNMFNESELNSSKSKIINALTELSYHFKTNNWDHTRNYYENDGTEELN